MIGSSLKLWSSKTDYGWIFQQKTKNCERKLNKKYSHYFDFSMDDLLNSCFLLTLISLGGGGYCDCISLEALFINGSYELKCQYNFILNFCNWEISDSGRSKRCRHNQEENYDWSFLNFRWFGLIVNFSRVFIWGLEYSPIIMDKMMFY